MTAAAFAEFTDRARDVEQLEEAGRAVEMGKLSNKLKNDSGVSTPCAGDVALPRRMSWPRARPWNLVVVSHDICIHRC
jgi:hypothetical protein